MARFRIHYWCPETSERKVVEREFEDTESGFSCTEFGTPLYIPRVTAEEWAEDCAYALADKNTDYEIERVNDL